MYLVESSIKEKVFFLVGGGSAVSIDFILYRIFILCDIDVTIAKTISYISGAVVGFIINKFWTFESKKFNISEVFRYIFLYAVSAMVNTLINTLVIIFTSMTIFAFLCATFVSMIINFIGQKFFVFRK